MNVHPNLVGLAPLLGVWTGIGRGTYPTIHPFDYADQWEFTTVGKPFLAFVQRTKNPADGQPMHTEAGYLRVPEPGTVEIVCALPTGQVELGAGRVAIDGGTLTVETDAAVSSTPTAKSVQRIVRRFQLAGDTMSYEMAMTAVGEPLTPHLVAELHRA